MLIIYLIGGLLRKRSVREMNRVTWHPAAEHSSLGCRA